MIAINDTIDNRRSLAIGELRLWALATVAIAYWANIVRAASPGGELTFTSAIGGILDQGAFDVVAWALILVRASTRLESPPARPLQILSAAVLGVIVMVPARPATAIALPLLAILFFSDPMLPRASRQIRLVLFALAFETLWMSPLMGPLHTLVGGYDAWAVTALLNALGQAATSHLNAIDNASSGFGIIILPYCTSSMPLAGVSVAFLVTVLYRDHPVRRSHLVWLGLSFAAAVMLNELRLAMMALDAETFEWWHHGPGASVYGFAALGSAVAFPALATSGLGEPKNDPIARAVTP